MPALLAGLIAGALLQGAPAATPGPDPCRLLQAGDIEAVQGAPLVERKPTEDAGRTLHYAGCFFATREFARSVSLTIITGDVQAYWRKTFHQPVTPASTRKKDPPKPVPALGEQAFWTGDGRTGSLYVLQGTTIVRISVGGTKADADRLRRTRALAERVMRRLADG